MKIDSDKMVTLDEAAKIRGVSYAAIHYLVKNGRLKSLKFMGRKLLFKDEVEKFEPDPGGRPKGSKSISKQGRSKSKQSRKNKKHAKGSD